MIVPIKVQRQVMGILVVMRKQANPFSDSDQHLLEAVADYASISLVNARLFRAIEARAQALQNLANLSLANEKITLEKLMSVERNLDTSIKNMASNLLELTQDVTTRWNQTQRKNLSSLKNTVLEFEILSKTIVPVSDYRKYRESTMTDLSALISELELRFKPIANQYNLQFFISFPEFPIWINTEKIQILEVLQGLVTNAIQFCQENGEIRVSYAQISNDLCQIDILNSGKISKKQVESFFQKSQNENGKKLRFAGTGISLELIQEIIRNINGKIWADQVDENKTGFHISLPIENSKAG